MLPKPYYQTKLGKLYYGDCLDILPHLEPVDLVLTDPPYMRVIKEDWDNQWRTDNDFLDYMRTIVRQFSFLLVPNGSIYIFASSIMAARIECLVREYFNVLNSIVWNKGVARKGVAGTGVDVTALRKFWSSFTERIIFAENYGADSDYSGAMVLENKTYFGACENAKIKVIGEYLGAEFKLAGVSNKDIAALFPSKNGGLTGCVSNWLMGANFPTKDQYLKIRSYLNSKNCGQYLRREYEDLRREYEDLRREYEDLRREYEDLRRPFHLTALVQWGEMWNFNLPKARTGHPCEKPISLIDHIINISSRPGQAILDPFLGSGTTAVSCEQLNRRWIGIEISEKYCEIAAKRIEQESKRSSMRLSNRKTNKSTMKKLRKE